MTPSRPAILFFAILFGLALQASVANARDIQTAIVAGGCFWCVESDFDKVNGVVSTTSGYTGGTTENPTYKKISKGGTGHYEAVKIKFDADVISYRELIDIFWRTVDPLDAGGQFCDRGDSYRTAVFAKGKSQLDAAQASKLSADAAINGKIVTPIISASRF
jgi:peptide-methionine (S)-S-oxide reductase